MSEEIVQQDTSKKRRLVAKNPVETVKRLLDYFSDYLGRLILGLAIWALGPILNITMTFMLKPIIAAMVAGDFNRLAKNLVIYGVLMIIRMLGIYFGQRIMMHLSQTVVYEIRKDLFSHLMTLPISYFDQTKRGDIMSTFTNDVGMLEQALSQSLPTVMTSTLNFVGTIIMMFVLDVRLTILVLVLLGLMLLLAKYITNKSGQQFRLQQERIAGLQGYTEEMLSGQKVIKVFNQEDENVKEFFKIASELRGTSTLAATLSVILFPIMGNLSYLMYAIVAVFGALASIGGRLTVDVVITFLQFTRSASNPITRLSNQMNLIISAIAGAERIFKLLDQEEEKDEGVVDVEVTKDGERYWLIPQENGEVKRKKVEGFIQFKNVDFGYVDDIQILHDIDLWAKPGQSIAFVGSTGAGKTTITNLITRFYEIDSGTITYDGIDIRNIKKSALRSTLGMVLQDVHLFQASVADNIRYGKLDASIDEVIKAAKAANAHSFIVRLPQGYNTKLDKDGSNLSEGERQLISIARAAVSNPVVLILDEATSSVDTRLEKMIAKGMDKISSEKTTFSIAHRLSTVRDADAILVLEEGVIIERGEHEELIEQKGRYYELSEGKAELE